MITEMIPLFKVYMPESVMTPLKNVLLSGYIGQGPKVVEFEKKLASFVGAQNCVTVNSGTSAIQLALLLAGVGPGSEVITTPMTCFATNAPILISGATPIWADIDPWTGLIDPSDVERKITSRTKAIVVVHWGGYPCDLKELNRVSNEYGIPLIEDAAHAFGSEYKGIPIGSHSPFTCFSFQAIKHLTTVDGGLLVCLGSELYKKAKLLRWYGIDRETPRGDLRCEEDIVEVGSKWHMNDVCAVIGIEQLKHISYILEKHRSNAVYYQDTLSNLKNIKLLRYEGNRKSSYWLFTVRVKDRSGFQRWLKSRGISASRVHVRNDLHTVMKDFRKPLPGVDEFEKEQISIPVGWWVDEDGRSRIVTAIQEWDKRAL